MNCRRNRFVYLLIGLILLLHAPLCCAQPGVAVDTESTALKPSPLPYWLRLGAQFRARADLARDESQSLSEINYLNRVRLYASATPTDWLAVHVQVQDARARGFRGENAGSFRNPIDLRVGFAEFGRDDRQLLVRVGRLELPLADEMLVGADSEWDPIGYRFDALHVQRRFGSWKTEAFAGFCVQYQNAGIDRPDRQNRLIGASAALGVDDNEEALSLYVLWKRGQQSLDLLERQGHRDVLTEGVRTRGHVGPKIGYVAEVALQQGHVVQDHMRAWAFHSELTWAPWASESAPQLAFTYNYASGDNNPNDGRHGTFDDLYPASYNAYGFPDPFAWRNLRSPEISAAIPFREKWEAQAGFRGYWLATSKDGLYPGGDPFLIRQPAVASTWIGSQWFASLGHNLSRHVSFHAGYGQMYSGTYLEACQLQSSLRTAYLQSTFTY